MRSSLALVAATAVSAGALPNRLEARQDDGSSSTDPNAPCGQQPYGYGPPSVPNTDEGFSHSPVFQAESLAAPAPFNYTAAFRNASGSTQQDGYMGMYVLQSYNTTQCGGFCDAATGCAAFNVYYERDPLLNPAAPNCTDPPPTTNILCTLWGGPVSADTATNQGQWRQDFHVVIAGSDGFNHV